MTEASLTLIRRLLVERYDELKRRLARRLGSAELAGEALQDAWLRIVRVDSVGVVRDPGSLKPNEADKLRGLSMARIFDGLRVLQGRPPAIPGDISPPFMPVLDETLIPCDPIGPLQDEGSDWCGVMIGVTREEYAAFSISNPGLDDLSEDELRCIFRTELGEAANAALERTRAHRIPQTPRTMLGDLHSERIFIRPSLAIAAAQARSGRNVFGYLFDWQSPNPALGACHCIDLPLLVRQHGCVEGSADAEGGGLARGQGTQPTVQRRVDSLC